jgi:putative phosphoribosyl transferase
MHAQAVFFADRTEAGRLLAQRFAGRVLADPVVLALPRGGAPVANEIALVLDAPLDVVLVRKIGAPGHPEFALGALVDAPEPILVMNEGVPAQLDDFVADEARRQTTEIERRRVLYRGVAPPEPLAGRTAIVVDDGVATGATFRAALMAVRRAGAAHVVAAIPVAPADSLEALELLADDIICLVTPEPFFAVGGHYADFGQVSDEEVIALLRDSRARQAGR